MPNEDNNQTAPEPVDIAQAFRMYNQANRAAAEGNVDTGDVDPSADGGEEEAGLGDGGAGENQAEAEPAAAPSAEFGEDDGDVGGSTNVVEPVDYSPAREQILKNIQNQALNDVRQQMREQQIEMWSIKDIYEKDEQTGRVTFHNPDNPNQPFSSRAEAQAFVDAMNKEVENYFRSEVNKRQQELVQNAAPIFQVIEYSPVYNAMSEVEQKVFDSLIEPYAITDNNGKVIGFNTNLVAAGNVARSIAKNFQSANPAQQAAQEQAQESKPAAAATRPATDMPTGKTESTLNSDDEPKTIGEALKMYDKMNREKKGK